MKCNKVFESVLGDGKMCICELPKHGKHKPHQGKLINDMRKVFEAIVGKKVYARKNYGDDNNHTGYLVLGGCEITTEDIARLLKANVPFTISDKIYVWKFLNYM